MKKFLLLASVAACALCLALGITACGGGNKEHVHNYGDFIPEQPATCTQEGVAAHYYCEGCGKYFDGEKRETTLADLKINVDPTAHKWGEWTETEATCERQGGELRVCTLNNSHIEIKNPIPALGHTLEENQLVCKTCNEKLAESLKFKLNSDDTYSLTLGAPTSDGKIMIPKIYNGLPVTSIGYEAFSGCTSLKNIIIPDSVISIGGYAFYECTTLTSVTIPDSVTSIDRSAFYDCTNLESIFITDIKAWCNIDFDTNYNYFANPLYYAHNLYLNNKPITEITADMLQGIEKIPSYAFSCTSLISITIPDSVTEICDSAFYRCASLTSITIPNSVTSIGDWAFSGCTNLESVTIPDGVTEIGGYAFYDCTNLESIFITDIKAWCNIDFGDYGSNSLWRAHNLYLNNNLVTEITADMLQGIEKIPSYAFSCTSLKNIIIPDSVISIGDYAFYECTTLTSVTIPNSVTSIGYEAFSGCTNLESVTIPDSVTYIGKNAFWGCANLERVIFKNPDGWYRTQSPDAASGTDIKSGDLQNPETAAQYLKSTYLYYYWYRKTT